MGQMTQITAKNYFGFIALLASILWFKVDSILATLMQPVTMLHRVNTESLFRYV
jgi:arginine exporter protein ArgO